MAVIDSGWDRSVGDPRVRPGIGLVDPADELAVLQSADDSDCAGHGTTCARLVLEIAPKAEILPIRVFGRRLETSASHLVEALRIATDRGAHVANLSLATRRRDVVLPLYQACEAASRRGLVIVAAAERRSGLGYPATFANVIGVEAVSSDDCWLEYDAGAAVECRACGAPPSTASPTVVQRGSRNSFAAARAAGVLAWFRESQPMGDVDQARKWLASTMSGGLFTLL